MEDKTKDYPDAANALKIAKITLMMQRNTVFYTTILFSMIQVITDEIPTAATDGKTLLINPTFFTNLSINERLFLLCHEVLHVALDHMHRIGKRDDFQLWNIAGDYVINGSLKDAQYTLIPSALYDANYTGKTTEQVYDILYKKQDKQKQALKDQCADKGSMNGNDITYPNAGDPKAVTQDDVTKVILRATTQAKAMGQDPGSLPAEIAIELMRVLNPPLPWHVIFQNYMTEFAKEDFSFRRPNRRFLPDTYLPMQHSESISNIAIFVDTSGSVSDKEFHSFISKISEIQESLKPKKVTVIAFDTTIKKVQELTENDNPFTKLKFTGRGGTSVKEVHEWVAANKPTFAVIFTDGQFSQIEPNNKSVPLIWIIHNAPTWKAKYGRAINYDIKL